MNIGNESMFNSNAIDLNQVLETDYNYLLITYQKYTQAVIHQANAISES